MKTGLKHAFGGGNRSFTPLPVPDPVVIISPEDEEAVRIVPMKLADLTNGLFGQYYRGEFLKSVDLMTSDKRKKTFSHVLNVLKKLDKIMNMSNSITLDGNIYNTLNSHLAESTSIMQAESVILYKIDEETEEFCQVGGSNTDRFPSDLGVVGHCASIGDLINLRKPGSFPNFSAAIDYPDGEGAPHGLLAIPVYIAPEKIGGVLVVVNKLSIPEQQPLIFDQDDEYLFKCLGHVFGILLGNTRVYESMNNTQKKVTVLLETTRSLASILDLNKLIKVIMDSAKELLSSDRCTLFLHDPERKQLRAIIQGRDSVQEIRIPSNAGIAGAVFTTGGI